MKSIKHAENLKLGTPGWEIDIVRSKTRRSRRGRKKTLPKNSIHHSLHLPVLYDYSDRTIYPILQTLISLQPEAKGKKKEKKENDRKQ